MDEDNGGSSSGELNSWKEVADYLRTTVRTAQRWESERRLPVRRLSGPRGRVVASVQEIDEWKKREALQPVRVWDNPTWLRWYAAGVTAVLLFTGGILGANYFSRNTGGTPAAFQWHDRQVVILDQNGNKLWAHTFPQSLHPDYFGKHATRDTVQHADLDGDGRLETLIAYAPDSHIRDGDELYCFSDTGEVLWRFVPGRLIRDAGMEFNPPYVFWYLRTLASPESPGERWVVATAGHHLGYMSQTVLVDGRGKLRGEYWHPGHFTTLEVADIDAEPGEEILLGGENRHRGEAAVVILDPAKLAEEGPRSGLDLDEVRSHAEKAVLFFPRTRLNRRLEEINHVGRVQWVEGMIEVQVEEARVQRPSSDLNYVFDREFRLKGIYPWDTIRSSYKEVFGSPEAGTRMFEEDLKMVGSNIEVIRNRSSAEGR